MIARTKDRIEGVSQRVEHVAQSLLHREPHVLLLQRQPQLVSERAAEAVRGHTKRGREGETGLDRDDQDVDQLRQLYSISTCARVRAS